MADEMHNNKSNGENLKGALWGIAIPTIVQAAQNFFGNGLGIIGSGCGNGYVTQRDAAKDAEIASLKADKKFLESNVYTDEKITESYKELKADIKCLENAINAQAVVNANIIATQNCQAQQIASFMSLTKCIIPINNVCPAPMPQYNSWVAPTTDTATAG